MKKPIVSFVIPVYKKDPEIFRQCLRSLFDQSLKDFEVICVFDGSDAALEQVASLFPVERLVIDHAGAPAARNAGFEAAKGTYVVAWDADCYIKPEAAKRWVQEFEKDPTIDFVYTGYELAGERGGFESEPFDHFSLTSGNYICSMAPIKREKAHEWDETLKGAQDWDYWLTAAERGLKGSWIPGSAFITDNSGTGISEGAWSAEKRGETIRRVKEKHGIPDRKVGVYTHQYYANGLKLAKILDADFIKPSGKSFEEYEMVFVFGYGWASRFDGIPKEVVKIQYWVPAEIAGLCEAKYSVVLETVRVAKGVINLCNTEYEKNRLADLGIEAEVVPLPLAEVDLENVCTTLPEKFKVLLVTDEAYGKLLKEIPQDLPHIEFVHGEASIKECSCVMSFYRFSALDDALLLAHVNGRNVISNVQAPYCGFVDPDAEYEDFKKALYEKIREVKAAAFNKEAQEYYLDFADPKKFAENILSRSRRVLEVVA